MQCIFVAVDNLCGETW